MIEAQETKPVRISHVSDWIKRQSETWWTIDGDRRFSRKLLMPADNQDMAKALNSYCTPDEKLDVLVPPRELAAGRDEIGRLFFRGSEGGDRQLMAKGGDDGDGWLLVEQTSWVKEVNAEVGASESGK